MEVQSQPSDEDESHDYLGSEADTEEPAPTLTTLLRIGEYLGEQLRSPLKVKVDKVEQTKEGVEAMGVTIKLNALGLAVLGTIIVLLAWM